MKLFLAVAVMLSACEPTIPAACDLASPVLPVDLSSPADMASTDQAESCVERTHQCLAPAKCCAGLTCVGGACALVGP